MSLADEVQALASRTLVALDASHDYYTYTKRVWRLLQQDVKEGRVFSFQNRVTGSKVNERALSGRAQLYIAGYLRASTFQDFVTRFEDFLFQLLRHWLAAYPGSLSKKHVDMATVLKAVNKDAILLAVVDRELNELKYERVADWFSYLENLANLGCPTASEIETFAEIKASRDVLVHNNGIVNVIYVSKAGRRARFRDGDDLEIPEDYHRESWQMIKRAVGDLAAAAIAKASPKPIPTN